MELIRRYTRDGLYLLGGHWENPRKKVCVIFTHGIFDSLTENFFIEEIGETLSRKGYGVIFGHNRGYGVINTIVAKDPITNKTSNKIIGSTYEKFMECPHDIDLWVETAKSLGYDKIILAGHSLGCLKNLYYLNTLKEDIIHGFIFVSPPDSSGLVNSKIKDSKEMFAEAKFNLEEGHSKKILTKNMLEIFPISSRSFYSFRKGGPIDIFPMIEFPNDFGIFGKISKPILAILGERDSVIIKSPEEDIKNIESRATSCSDFTGVIIEKATHRFINKDTELSLCILNWLHKRF